MFFDDGELESFLLLILRTCRTTIAGELELFLNKFSVARASNGSSPRATRVSEVRTASELLAFVPAGDKEVCRTIIESLGSYSMPREGIEEAIMQIMEKSRPLFLEKVRYDFKNHCRMTCNSGLFVAEPK